MKDMILLLSTLAMFLFGYFLMKKLDAFLEENHRFITGDHDDSESA